MSNLRVTLVQTSLHWENIPANLSMLDKKLEGLAGKTDLIILPEMFSTGFSMQPEKLAEMPDGPTTHWMAAKAQELNAVITGRRSEERRDGKECVCKCSSRCARNHKKK